MTYFEFEAITCEGRVDRCRISPLFVLAVYLLPQEKTAININSPVAKRKMPIYTWNMSTHIAGTSVVRYINHGERRLVSKHIITYGQSAYLFRPTGLLIGHMAKITDSRLDILQSLLLE